ncbi:multiple epidermal growth factor-like domains 10 [Plakobranchus ocellatus]|uniref:Multiple epidermal growth factor-like domains 10 n=1 Tax=Plakobranchus ocellatus TaxID=259542 RepID=A0AAV4CJY4_9GAST|nr:multiple epidermal growth factor-like domains 10 [Plakobranchus ocellatus]
MSISAAYLDQFELRYQIAGSGTFIRCANIRSARIDDSTLDISCPTSDVVSHVTVSGFRVRGLCSLYISGGRNVALNQAADQTKTYFDWYASNAVDGDPGIPDDHSSISSTCSHTEVGLGDSAFWRVIFSIDVDINRFIIYNRREKRPFDCCEKRLVNFTLEVFPSTGKNRQYTYTDPGGPAQKVYTVVPSPRIGFPVKTVFIHVRKNRQNDIITLCEVYAFGEVVCPPGKFGRQCERDCNCADQTEACFVSTGGCPSGCAAGYTGEDCYTPCPFGQFGLECLQSCSVSCAGQDNACNHITGDCDSGCDPGYKTKQCNVSCPFGLFGLECLQSCSVSCAGQDNACNHITGDCDSGCDPGYKTKQCNVSCEPGTYGRDCMETCSDHCAGGSMSCHFVTGFCDQGCEAGYLMPLCIHALQENESSGSGKLGIGIIIGVFSTVAVTAVVLGVIFWRRRNVNLKLAEKLRNKEVKDYPQSDPSDGSGLKHSQRREVQPEQGNQNVSAESTFTCDEEEGNNDHQYMTMTESDFYNRPKNLPEDEPYELPLSLAQSAQARDKPKYQKKQTAVGDDEGRFHVYQNTGVIKEI